MIRFNGVTSKKNLALLFSIAIITLFFSIDFIRNDDVSASLTTPQVNQDLSKKLLIDGGYEPTSEQEILKLKMFRLASIDGAIRADQAGNLILDRELRHWVDFYLSALGELSLNKIRELMQREINQLPMSARDQATQLLNNYLAYKEALADYDDQTQSPAGDYIERLQDRHDWQKRLRRQILTADTVEAFWRLDELIDDHALEKLIIRNSDHNTEEKNRQLEQLEADLPEEISGFRQQLYIASNLQNEVDRYREQGGSDESIRQLRIDSVGLEAAERLGELDKAQSLWQLRILAYRDELNTINNITGLSVQDKQERLKNYRDVNFVVNEQLRLETALKLLNLQ
jgi:lipase chaperone LimK